MYIRINGFVHPLSRLHHHPLTIVHRYSVGARSETGAVMPVESTSLPCCRRRCCAGACMSSALLLAFFLCFLPVMSHP